MRLVDADELLKDEHQHYSYIADEFYVRVRDIEDAPTIEERKKGKWIKRTSLFQCSACERFFTLKYNYCPNCGADNREERNDD